MMIKYLFVFLVCSNTLIGISQVVIPAAGLGTRFLPITKVMPKELLPVAHKPALQWIFDEIQHAGCTQVGLIISEKKRSAFDQLCADQDVIGCSFFTQQEMKGLGHAVLMSEPFITESYFGVILPDMIYMNTQSAFAQIKRAADKYHACVIGVQQVPESEIHKYGIIDIAQEIESGVFVLQSMVEKPSAQDAPSSYAVMGRYVLPRAIFPIIKKLAPDKKGEIQLTDAIAQLIKNGQRVLACVMDGTMFDTGQPPGWLDANNYASGNQ